MKKYTIAVLLCLQAVVSFGQDKFAPDLNIKTPEVGAMLKFIETPVSYNTGLPNISVPIYSIQEGDISYPIAVSYNASGVNVNERAGWVGMGFSISQPQVTRNVKGIADDVYGFITESLYLVDGGYVENHWSEAYQRGTDGMIDLESDEYRAILPSGESITFYFSQQRSVAFPYGEIIQAPYTANKITPLFTNNRITGWNILTTNGEEYTFSNGNEVSATYSYSTTNEDLPTLNGKSKSGSYVTSWVLSKIKSAKNNELNFTYASHYYSDCNQTNQRRDVDMDSDPDLPVTEKVFTNFQKTVGFNYFLASISGNFGKVSFVLDTASREDYTYGKKLSKIKIQDKNDNLINEYSFQYVYKVSDSPVRTIYSCGTIHDPNDLNKRLFLDKILVMGNTPTSSTPKPSYSFAYNDLPLPHRFSYALDWWGYYNGKDNNPSLVPTIRRNDFLMPDRNVNTSTSQAGLLTKFTSPTGGYTTFEFESNRGINDKPITKLFDNISHAGTQTRIDGINIIPSKKNYVNFNTTASTPVSITNVVTGGKKMVYEMPFTLGTNVIGYNYGKLSENEPYTLNMLINVDAVCNSCIYDMGSLPDGDNCSVYFKVLKGNVVLYNKLLPGEYHGSLEVKVTDTDPETITAQNYKLVVEVFTGDDQATQQFNTNPNDNIPNGSIDLNLNWEVYDETLVTKFGASYDIAVGGHRIKKIKTYESASATPLEKQFDYRDANGHDSGYCNFKLANLFRYANVVYLNSDNYYPLQFYSGQPVGYSMVKEKTISGAEVKESAYSYDYSVDPKSTCHCYWASASYGVGTYPCFEFPGNGKLLENTIGNVQKTTNEYTIPMTNLYVTYIKGFNMSNRVEADYHLSGPDYDYSRYKIFNFHDVNLVQSTVADYFNGIPVEKQTTNIYNNTSHLLLTEQIAKFSNNEKQTTKYYYPQDASMSGQPFVNDLIAKNRVAVPLETENYSGSTKIAEQKTIYAKDITTGDLLLPKNIYAAGFPNNLPSLGSAIGTLEKRITYDRYDDKGNILQYTLEGGNPVSVVWSHNRMYPVAKIENMAYANIPTNLITAIAAAPTESNLNALRNDNALVNAMVTTYTYKSLVGITSMTDPKGFKTTYDYDEFNRLKQVKDQDGNVLSENQYHYKTQN